MTGLHPIIPVAGLLFGLAAPGMAQTGADGQERPLAPEGLDAPLVTPGVILQGLDKVTARIDTITTPLDRLVTFGTLGITVRDCHKAPPTEPPESTAFLEIVEAPAGAPSRILFEGWMFASSPALSALEHPVYDVWVISCTNLENSPASNSQ